MASAVPEVLRSAVVRVCRDAFWYRGDVEALFLAAGVSPALWARHSADDASKARIARGVLSELASLGSSGDVIQKRIISELCRMSKPHPEAPDEAKGRAALDDLRAEAKRGGALLVDPETSAATQRQEQAKRRAFAEQQRREKLGAARDTFFELLRAKPRAISDRQARGYALESLLADLFEVYDLTYRRPYRAPHEQVDGSFHFRGFTYIVEVKWESSPPDFGQLAKFKANVDGKLESTRGMFVSMTGYDDNALDHLFKVARNSRNNLVLVDVHDLIAIFEGRITLLDALTEKVDAAEQTGEAWHPLGR
jgi:hypothetical protein